MMAVLSLSVALGGCRTDPSPQPPRTERVSPSTTPSTTVASNPAVVEPAASPSSSEGKKASPESLLVDVPHFYPKTRDGEKRPLLVFLHGLGASGKLSFEVLRLRDLGERFNLFVVAPDGTLSSRGQRFWNAHPACCNFDGAPVDHVAYLSRLIDELTQTQAVDPRKIYVLGFSNGGFMAHRLACEWGDRLAGVVSVAGAGPLADKVCAKPAGRMRILEMHGDADKTVFYEGGTLFDRPNAAYASSRDTVLDWSRRLSCKGEPSRGAPMDLIPNLDGAETDPLTYENCAHGSVSLWTVHGGSHLFGNRLSVLEKAWLYLNPDSGSSPRL